MPRTLGHHSQRFRQRLSKLWLKWSCALFKPAIVRPEPYVVPQRARFRTHHPTQSAINTSVFRNPSAWAGHRRVKLLRCDVQHRSNNEEYRTPCRMELWSFDSTSGNARSQSCSVGFGIYFQVLFRKFLSAQWPFAVHLSAARRTLSAFFTGLEPIRRWLLNGLPGVHRGIFVSLQRCNGGQVQ